MYVVVDESLSGSQQAVQAGHAIAAWVLSDFEKTWANETLVLLATDRLEELVEEARKDGRKAVVFREPDRGNTVTSFATAVAPDERVFADLKPIKLRSV